MAGITLTDAQAHLDEWLTENLAVTKGQSYSIAGRSLTRADAEDIRVGEAPLRGKTSEGFYYLEAIAENLLRLEIKNRLSQISPIQRKNYKVDHDGVTQRRTSRYVEICAKELYKRDLPYIGRIIDYQVPLKARQSDKAGKIDLIAYRENPQNALIVELKFKDNAETLLRAALEISTYYHMLSHENFLASYKEFTGLNPLDIKKALLLGEGTRSYDDARNLDRFPNMKRLLRELELEIYGLRSFEEHHEVERIAF